MPEELKTLLEPDEFQNPNDKKEDPYGPVYNLMKPDNEPDYYEDQKKLEKMKRTNALGDAFRLLSDVVGYNKGATVQKRTPQDFQPSSDRIQQLIRSGKDRDRQFNLNIALQKAKQKQEELGREQANQEWDRRQQETFERQKELLGARGENTLGLVGERKKNAIELENLRQQRRAENIAAQNEFREKLSRNKTTQNGLYPLKSDDGLTDESYLDKAGVDKMFNEIIKDPALANDFKIIVGKYGNQYNTDVLKRQFVQDYWSATDNLKGLGVNLNRGQSQPSAGLDLNSQLNIIYEDQNMSMENKKRRMADAIITSKYPDGKVPRAFLEQVKNMVNNYFK